MTAHWLANEPLRFRTIAGFAAIAPLLASSLQAAPPRGNSDNPLVTQRVVHVFDFAERDDGNLEPIPKFWVPFEGAEFPRFASGSFDDSVGHNAPPSFLLETEGRNIAFRYTGDATRIEPQSDYRITGWVRADELSSARATLSAYYIDRDGLPLRSTQRFGQLVGGESREAWHQVEVYLPVGPPEARTIGITAWVVQEEVWRGPARLSWRTPRADVRARAWFDDIVVQPLPRIVLETPMPGGVFERDGGQALLVAVTDADAGTLRAQLQIFDVQERLVHSQPIDVQSGEVPVPEEVSVTEYANGLYRASIRVTADGEILTDRSRSFAVVGGNSHHRSPAVRSFGVVLDRRGPIESRVDLTMLRTLNVGAVKIPVWTGSGDVPDLAETTGAADTLLYELLKARVEITGVLAGAPSKIAETMPSHASSLFTLLESDRAVWSEHLARVVASYTSVFRSWQVGQDDEPALVTDPRLDQTIRLIRDEMETLTTAPSITSPGSVALEPPDETPIADRLCLTIDSAVAPQFIDDYLQTYRNRTRHVSSVYLQPFDADGVDRLGQWRDWCKRLIMVRHSGVETVFVPQPWHSRATPGGDIIEPTGEFVILDTLTHVLRDAAPGDKVYVAPGVKALSFHLGDETILAMWDDAAGPDGRTHEIQLGSASRQLTMWGQDSPLVRTDDGRQRVRLTSSPVFVPNVERWLIMFRTLVTLTPSLVDFRIDAHQAELSITNPHTQAIEGIANVESPEGIQMRPRQFRLALAPGETRAWNVEIRVDRNQTAGPKTLPIHCDLNADQTYHLVVPLALRIGTKDLDAWGLAFMAGDRLIVRHGVSNLSDRPLTLRSFAIAPGRPRQYRLLQSLQPGRSTTVEYRFRDAGSLRGRSLRLNVRELDGPRMHNLEIAVD